MLHECMQQHNLVAPNVAELESTQLKCNSNGDGVCGVVPFHPLPASHTGECSSNAFHSARIWQSPSAREPEMVAHNFPRLVLVSMMGSRAMYR